MAKYVNPTKVITGPETRWSYANVWQPKAIDGGAPKYSVSLIIPKSDTKTIEKVRAAIQAAYDEGQGKLKGNGKSVPPLSSIKTPLRDGDVERPDDEAYANAYFINANSASAPGIVDAACQPIIDTSEVYSGVYGRASINFYAFNSNGNDAVTLGTLVSFVIYSKLFSQPLTTFAQAMTSLQQASAASRRVFELLDSEEMADESKKKIVSAQVNGNVEFKNVHFRYESGKPIIRDFSASLKQGQKVAIVGPTGAGKTTIVNLLMRFYDVQSGDILIDGVSTKTMRRETVHDLFDMILQDTWLFEGTVRENLVYNKQDVSDERLDQVCEAVGLRHFIKTLPNGYDTVLNESVSLSEGQKQQLTIARAMIKDSPLLILDEATSSVDTRTELVIQDAMDRLTENRTSFVIAHRLSTIRDADIILVMKDGDIIEQGDHDTLLKQNGFYAELYNSQFENVG